MENENILKFVIDIFCKDNRISRPIKNVGEFKKAFLILKKQIDIKNFNALYIANYLHEDIANEEKRKRKVTARDFEDFLALFLGGKVEDNESRKNRDVKCDIKDSFVKKYAISNRREKGDVTFKNFELTVKTFVPDNKEINCGSFAREALFTDILENYGGERKGGLGSKPQLLKKLNEIKSAGKWNAFLKRFKEMLSCIYADDLICAIKGGNYLDVYILAGKKFRALLINNAKTGPRGTVQIINRYEGNSIRIERDKVLAISDRIHFNLKSIEPNKITEIKTAINKLEIEIIKGANGIIAKKQFNKTFQSFNSKLSSLVFRP